MIVQYRAPDEPWEIWMMPLDHPEQAKAVIASQFQNTRPDLSPDGRWLAFESNESGAGEVYVVGIGAAHGRWQVSTRGGEEPHWGPDGKELFYLSPEQKLMRRAGDDGRVVRRRGARSLVPHGHRSPPLPQPLPRGPGRTALPGAGAPGRPEQPAHHNHAQLEPAARAVRTLP
jgi:dipeptidyl aminopeptidase/acylaminoacyl peptidase